LSGTCESSILSRYIPLTIQIDPKIVREAYSLLRQSIIHVEQDDINFDEEDEAAAILNGTSNRGTNGHTTQDEESQDAADIAAMEAAESSYNATSSAAAAAAQANGGTTDESVPKRKMRITCTFFH
jgi:DNA replication licensing factor MCM6